MRRLLFFFIATPNRLTQWEPLGSNLQRALKTLTINRTWKWDDDDDDDDDDEEEEEEDNAPVDEGTDHRADWYGSDIICLGIAIIMTLHMSYSCDVDEHDELEDDKRIVTLMTLMMPDHNTNYNVKTMEVIMMLISSIIVIML